MNSFLPVTKSEMLERNITQPDFVFIIADAYVDHPSFGPAIISRLLEAKGYSVCIIAQPDWKDLDSIDVFGEPRLAFLISGGNMDSMVNHYYVSKKRRQTDAYSPGGVMGKRPDHATVVYGNMIRRKYRNTPIVIGGIEASLRRFAHYDYWSDSFKRSILLDSGADLISYGMGEKSIVEIAEALDSGMDIRDITYIRGTVYKTKTVDVVYDGRILPDYLSARENKKLHAKSFLIQYENTDAHTANALVEEYPNQIYVVANPPSFPLTVEEMDEVYRLDYARTYHPMYEAEGGIPAIKEVKFSLISNRGCFGGCSFCALTYHQGRTIQVRSHESIIDEAKLLIEDKEFKGYIHDVGGPTANFRMPSCEKQLEKGVCKKQQCLYPRPCKNLTVDHSDYLRLLRKLREMPKVKKVFVRSGIRFDYLLCDPDKTFFKELVEHHISGQLKVAPEHISDAVLARMGKPPKKVYEDFLEEYHQLNEELGKNQFVVPYLMSSHPGSTSEDAIALAEYLRDIGYMPEQVQDFYPTPSTLSTVMYYTGYDPRNMKPVFVEKNPHEKAMQRALIQYRNPKNRELVMEALQKAGRTDLIGFGQECFIKPRVLRKEKSKASGTEKPAGKPTAKPKGKPTAKPAAKPKTFNSKNTTRRKPK